MAKSAAVKIEVRWRETGTTQWSDIQSCSPAAQIVVEGLDRTKTYDFEWRGVSACGARSAWGSTSHAIADVPAGTIVLSDLKTEVDNAAADAAAANAELANIASDNVLSQGEKPTVIRDYNVISTEQAGIDAQASSFGITTEKTDYDNAVTALTGYLGTLTSPTAWNNLTGDTTIVGTTFRQKFADVYTTRQALLNAIYAAAKAKADAAQGTANTANANTPAVINPQFKNGSTGWTFDNPAGFYQENGANSPDSACATYLVRQGQSGGAPTVARNMGYVAVQVGQTVIANCCIKALSCNAGAIAQVRISWRDLNHTELSVTLASITCGPGGTYLQCVSKAMGQAPASAQFAHLELYYTTHSSGYFTATSANLAVLPATIDEVPDGPTNARTLATRVNGGKPVIDFSESIHFNKQLDNIGDGSTYYRMPATNMDGSRRALIDFTQGSHVGKILDNIGDGATYGRPLGSRLNAGNPLIDFSAGYHLNKNIDNLSDGSAYRRVRAAQVSGGIVSVNTAGRNCIFNPSFTQNAIGTANGASVSSGTAIDGWQVSNGSAYAVAIPFSGSLRSRGLAGLSIAASGNTVAAQINSQFFAVLANQTYRLHVNRSNSNAGIALPLGVTAFHRIFVQFYDALGGFIANGNIQDVALSSASGDYYYSGTVPSGATQCTFAFYVLFNNTGAATSLPASSYYDAIINFAEFIQATHLDNDVIDGTTYARIKGTELSSGVHKLGVAGSGALLGNQLNIPNSLTLNYGAVRSATALTASSTGAVSVNAFTYYMGAAAVNYSAVSNAVTGLTQGTSYYIYTRDPGGTGGTKTWSATTNVNALLQTYDDIVVAGQVTIPTSGSSGGGGTGGCPVVGAWVIRRAGDSWAFARAGDVAEGDALLLTSGQWGRVSHSRAVLQPCVTVQDADGFALSCSRTAPLGRADGTQVLAPDAAGELIEVRRGIVMGTSRVATVRDIGEQWVQHITCENDFFWVGDQTDRLFSHHNLKP